MLVIAAVAVTMLMVAWTGWRAVLDLERIEHRCGFEAEPVARRPQLRLVEPVALTGA
jgi:hypothetical protein